MSPKIFAPPTAPRRSPLTRRPGRAVARGASGCPIVGIGASAGGLEAFTQLLKHLPVDTGFGFVLVQHLDPQHESALTQLLARATTMPVREITNNLRVLANQVYIIPRNRDLGITRGILKLLPRSPHRIAPRSIDSFFEALAKDQCGRAVGVILSGSATDGTLGLEAIKAEGGLTFAQDDTATFDSMPRSAVAAGCVDFVHSPANIARELAWIAKHPSVAGRPAGPAPRPAGARAGPTDGAAGGPEPDDYKKIILLLRNHCGVDFSLYKSSTILRRMTRRMVLNRQHTLAHYAGFLRGNVKELDALYTDALINVTSFFRNADAFTALKSRVFAPLLSHRGDDPVRVWVLGCSTGQEAYSIAMAFAEVAEKIPRARKLQVFATDLNESNLAKGRQGLYAKSVAQDVSPERLRRFFAEEEGGYRVVKSLREQVVFARHDIISDPPFSRMDLISCRNVMIYLEPGLQQKVIPAFHYALKPGGCLLLGASESIGTFSDLFAVVDKRQKIFAKKAAPTLAFHLPLWRERGARPLPEPIPRVPAPPGGAAAAFRGELTAEREADRVTVNQFAPPGVLIDGELRILQFRGPTGDYLEPPTGKASFDLLKMARDGLMLPLRATINRAKKEQAVARRDQVPFKLNGRSRVVNVEVVPLKNLKERRFLVLFEDAAGRPGGPPAPLSSGATPPGRLGKREESSRILRLERKLAEARDYLQSVQEHQDAANEELQASNEEGQSANEELQSLNEELETSKEELESTNEELTTVNEEMAGRNAELSVLNSDLANFQSSAQLIVVLLGRDLTIRRFSTQAEKQFHLRLGDLGRPIGDVRHHLDMPDLETVITGVIAQVREFEREVRDLGGQWHSLRVRPYLTVDNKVDGAVLVLTDINASKLREGALRKAQAELARHSETLEAQVRTRTAKLTQSNQQLAAAVVTNREAKERFRLLLADSEAMRKKLRLLTHQILSAQEEERKKISRELHDEVVQTLVAINVELAALVHGNAPGVQLLRDKIAHTCRLVEDSVEAVHRFARELRPAVLDDLGLIPALHAFCQSLAARKHFKIHLRAFAGIEALSGDRRTVLFRVAQEALTNVARHARATKAELNFSKIPGAVRMEIRDNGKAFPVKKVFLAKNPKRLGLVGMKERIEMIGGSFMIESATGVGTTVRAEIPFGPPRSKRSKP